MKEKNYKSDFDFILTLSACNGKDKVIDIGWPDFDWVAKFYTSTKANCYVASCRGGECVNCFNDNGRIHVVCKGHGLQSGVLQCEFKAYLPDAIYPDGERVEYTPKPLDIELVRGAGDCDINIDVEATLPLIKGDKGDKGDAFTFADFTPEEIAELQRPATEATTAANVAAKNAVAAVANMSNEFAAKQNVFTTTDDLLLRDDILSLTDMAKKRLFIDLWNEACKSFYKDTVYGSYNPITDLFDLYDDYHLSYEEAVQVYLYSRTAPAVKGVACHYTRAPIKYLLPTRGIRGANSFQEFVNGCKNLIACALTGNDNVVEMGSMTGMFAVCEKLEVIKGTFYMNGSGDMNNTFKDCRSLREMRFYALRTSFSVSDSPLLSFDTVSSMITLRPKSFDTYPITITLHPDVYAKITDEDNPDYEQWHPLLALAADKNISLATV